MTNPIFGTSEVTRGMNLSETFRFAEILVAKYVLNGGKWLREGLERSAV